MKGLSCESTLIARMLGTMSKNLQIPRYSTAAKTLRTDHELEVADYFDEAWCIDLSISEKDNHTPLTSFEHVTTAIVLVPMHEDFDTLRADIAAIHHAKLGHGNEKGQNETLRPDQLPTLTIQHGSLSSREPQVLKSIELMFALNSAAKNDKETNTISAVMPRRTLKEISTLKSLVLTPEVEQR